MRNETAVLDVVGLRKNYGQDSILKDISFSLNKGETISVIGPSGSGKSTLARCVCGLESLNGGKILVNGESVHGLTDNPRAKSRYVGIVFQQFNLWPHMTVEANVAAALKICRKLSHDEAHDVAASMLRRVHLTHRAGHKPSSLSGGEQQRVAIARSLALAPALLVFDEPTSALDPELSGEVLEVMRELSSDGVSMLVITHEMRFARDVAQHVIFMDEGYIFEQGAPAQVFEAPKSSRTQTFLQRVLTH